MKHYLPDVEPEKIGAVEFNGSDPYPSSYAMKMTDGKYVVYDKRVIQPIPYVSRLFDGLTLFRGNYDHPRKHEKK